MPCLYLSASTSPDHQRLWRAAVRRNWRVVRTRGPRVEQAAADEPILYVEPIFAPATAAALGITLADLPEDWLVSVPRQYLSRSVRLVDAREARQLPGPAFFKPPNDKSFAAAVLESGANLPPEATGPVLVCTPVRFEVEHRHFVLNRGVVTSSPYIRYGRMAVLDDYEAPMEECEEAAAFAASVLDNIAVEVPPGVVLDVGRLDTGQWAVVEANGAWGAGLYGCDADAVLDVLRACVQQA